MQNLEFAESEEKSYFSDFYFSSNGHFCTNNCQFSMNFHDISKNKNRKIDFSFDSSHCASIVKIGAKLSERGGGGSVYPYLGQGRGSYIPDSKHNYIFNCIFVKIFCCLRKVMEIF